MRLALLLTLFLSAPAYALSLQDSPTLTPDMMPLPKAKEGTVPWQLFLTTKEKQQKITYPDGGYSFEVTPIFGDGLKALNGKEIQLYGFMFPLEQSEKQSDFLIGPYPPSCPFHYHVPPSLIVEVRTSEPINFSWDEVRLKGTLELAEKDENGIFYYLKGAVQVK